MVSVWFLSSISVNLLRIRSISESWPFWKSSHGGRFLKAVIAKLSERVKATKGRPCFDAALNLLPLVRLMTTPSVSVMPYALCTVSA